MKRFTFAWGILITCFMLAFSNGVFNLPVSSFLITPVQQEMVWSRSLVLLLLSLQSLVTLIATFIIGMIIDKKGPRLIVIVSACCLWISFMILSKLQNLPLFLIYFSLMGGIGAAGISNAIIFTVIGKWFRTHRGMILGLVLLGSSLSITSIPPVIHTVVENGIGWRTYWWAFSLVPLVSIVPLAIFFLKREPADSGYTPFFSHHRFLCDEENKDPVNSFTLSQVLKTKSYWLILGAWLLSSLAIKLIYTVILPYATERGIPVESHSGFLAMIFVCVPVGLILFGTISDFVSARILAAILCGVQAMGLLMMVFFNNQLFSFGVLGGLSNGGLLVVLPLLVMKYFGPAHLGKIVGVTTVVYGLADFFTFVYLNFFHEEVDSYQGVVALSVVCLLVAAVLVGFARRPNRRRA